ncbi:MAG: hypothetical protein IT573_07240 [Deltaproteobacteria bacterium]|nr:hypothetical protein [Deltaproteobacteria bacterium]
MGKKKKRTVKIKKAVKKAAKAARTASSLPKKSAVNVRRLEAEINRMSELLDTIKKKSALVRRSLAYLEREQKAVMKQIKHARGFLLRLKNRGMRALQNFPQNAEELYQQVKREFNRVSKRWTS